MESKHKLGTVKLFRNLELGSMGKNIHCLMMDHSVAEDPKVVGNFQEVGNHTNCPGGGFAMGRDASQLGVL